MAAPANPCNFVTNVKFALLMATGPGVDSATATMSRNSLFQAIFLFNELISNGSAIHSVSAAKGERDFKNVMK